MDPLCPNDAVELLLKMRKAALDFEAKHGKPRTEPLELTKAQYDSLKSQCEEMFSMPSDQPFNSFYGVPLVIKSELPYMGEKEDAHIPPPAPRTVNGVVQKAIREWDE